MHAKRATMTHLAALLSSFKAFLILQVSGV